MTELFNSKIKDQNAKLWNAFGGNLIISRNGMHSIPYNCVLCNEPRTSDPAPTRTSLGVPTTNARENRGLNVGNWCALVSAEAEPEQEAHPTKYYPESLISST